MWPVSQQKRIHWADTIIKKKKKTRKEKFPFRLHKLLASVRGEHILFVAWANKTKMMRARYWMGRDSTNFLN